MSAKNDGDTGQQDDSHVESGGGQDRQPTSEDEEMFLAEMNLHQVSERFQRALGEKLQHDDLLVKMVGEMLFYGRGSLKAIRRRYAGTLKEDVMQALEERANRNVDAYFMEWKRSRSQSKSDEATIPSQILLPESTSGGSPANEMSFEMMDHSRQDNSFARGPSEDGEVGANADQSAFDNRQDESMEEAERRLPDRSESSLGRTSAAEDSFESGSSNRAARRPPRHLDYDNQSFRELLARVDEHWEPGELMVAETTLLRPLLRFIDSVFDSGELPRIVDGASDFLRVIDNLSGYNRLLGARMGREAKRATKEVDLSSTRAIGAILLDCARNDAEFESSTLQEQPEVTAQILQVKRALYRLKKGDNATHGNYEKAISNFALQQFLVVGSPTNNLVQHCLCLVWAHFFLTETTLSEALAGLGQRGTMILGDLEQLAERIDPAVPFDEDLSILGFLSIFVSPAMATGLWAKASQLTSELFACLTQTETPGLSQNRQRTGNASTDVRQECILERSATAEFSTVGGDESDRTDESYFSGTDIVHSERRARGFRTYLCMFLKEPIQRCLPPDFFSKRGYTSYFLGLSATKIREECLFITPTFFAAKHGPGSPVATRIKKNILSKKEGDARRTIIIESREQVDRLKRLVGAT